MVDTQYLEDIIASSGKKKTYLADVIGCSVQNFRLKCTNKSDFRLSEVDKLCTELGIGRIDKEKIFFKK